LSAQAVLDLAKHNAAGQTSVHVKGTGACPNWPFAVDMKLRNDGTGTGTVTVGINTVKLVSSPTALYIQGDAEFWSAEVGNGAAEKFQSKWVKLLPANNPCLTALGSFSAIQANYLNYPGTPTLGNSQAVFGVPAVMVQTPPDVVTWVRAKGEALPIQIDQPSQQTKIAMGEWGAPVTVTIPSGPDVVDGSAVTKK